MIAQPDPPPDFEPCTRVAEVAAREGLLELLNHALAKAGNASLMTAELIDTLVDHAAGNYRSLMNMANDLLAVAMQREVEQIDQKLFFEVFDLQATSSNRRKR